MTNLVVCCDGTWNTPEDMDHGLSSPTNVVKLYNALVRDDSQLPYYHPGVGTGKGLWDRFAGGSFGEGLDQSIMSAYRWLGSHYSPGDRICLFGFSRGAYTVRSLGGLITKCGLIDLSKRMSVDDVWKRVGEVFAAYRKGIEFANSENYPFHNVTAGQPIKDSTKIHFIGVWDTVGALGIPDDFALLGLLDNPVRYRFHDTALSETVSHARHAVALDEHRESFAPTLWTNKSHPDLKQIWFPGVHCDVGGGYLEAELSDRALEWMMDEAEACGVSFRPNVREQLKPDPLGFVHDSCTGVFKALKTRPRPAPSITTGTAILDQSAIERNKTPPLRHGEYWPTEQLAAGASRTVNIYAAEHWQWTGLYLEAGRTYKFTAEGQWVDHRDRFGPAGGEATGFHLGDLVRSASSVLGKAETIFKKVTGREADFWYTRRVEQAPWFALVGFIASGVGEDAKEPASGETFVIGEEATRTPKLGGYLYGFANDAWQTYNNNRGSVALTVKRAQ